MPTPLDSLKKCTFRYLFFWSGEGRNIVEELSYILENRSTFLIEDSITYVEVLLPLAIPKTYTYSVPLELLEQLEIGKRVEAPLRNKLYSGIIAVIHWNRPVSKVRNIIDVIDDHPIVGQLQLEFWQWMADYYLANIGEVMAVALPGGLRLSSETSFVFNSHTDYTSLELSDDEYLIAEALSMQQEINIGIVQDILNKKTVYPIIKNLLAHRVIFIKEELKERYKEKALDFVSLLSPFDKDIEAALELTTRSEKQSRTLLTIASMSRAQKRVSKKEAYQAASSDSATIKALEKKGIIKIESLPVSRISILDQDDDLEFELQELSTVQKAAHEEIQVIHAGGKVVLLHGVTGSGKTRIYIEHILEVLKSGGQVLLLLPEIALTTQIVDRLKVQIGELLYVYHSKINDHERVEIWNAAQYANKLFVGARSALFLPFQDLRLIIVDEEHDPSFKQNQPSPRYQGRDGAIKLAQLYNANVILGSATPSLESKNNVTIGKYGYVQLKERYGEAVMPEVQLIDLKDAYQKGLVKDHFTKELLDAIQDTKDAGGQILLFQNRRGYAPVLKCGFCGWASECPNCDNTLTYHQRVQDMKCHFCGYRQRKADTCPQCGKVDLHLIGAGTERIENVVEELLPGIRAARFDYDTTRSKKNQEKILHAFNTRQLDVLVGTQMITKGFDFDNIALVGVINADSLLSFPDFRSGERTFQLLMQVAGRAGRRKDPGKVLIQAFQLEHPVLQEVLSDNYERFFNREIGERKTDVFPPIYHLITVWFLHRDYLKAKVASEKYVQILKAKIGSRLVGPADAGPLRVRNQYRLICNIRIEKDPKTVKRVKNLILSAKNELTKDRASRSVRINIDVDPY